ncbi:MAG TPA: cellulase family glycosylhydrolase [Polyangiaceae bacterium]|jgi:hypothetical protein|nr:cellulase family glycosylhydrolase [Polyangiaceae bacterium]
MSDTFRGLGAVLLVVVTAFAALSGCSSSSSDAPSGSGGQGTTQGGAAGSGASSSGTGASSSSTGASTGTGASPGTSGGGSSGAGVISGSGAVSASSGGTLSGGGTSPGSAGTTTGSGGTPVATGPVAVDTTAGRWRTAKDATTGRFGFITPDGAPAVLKGISMTGLETGTRETAAGAGFWLYLSGMSPEATNTPTVLGNVIKTLVGDWKTTVVRIPICGSAWAQNYVVHDWGNAKIANYRDWVDLAVKQARQSGAVVIIDNHLWAIAKMGNGGGVDRGTFTSNGVTHKYSEYEDGCTGVNKVSGTDSCAPSDWYAADANTWECAIANADGVTIHNAYKNKDNISSMWADIAGRYKSDSGVWFELYNEPYSRKAATPFPSAGVNEDEKDYPWDLWSDYMLTQITSIRDKAQAPNIVLVNGLDWGYDFGPEYGPIAHPDQYLPWKSKYANVAYSFHPYQHGACCGAIGASGTDASATDPYESGFCSYYSDGTQWGKASGAALPAPGKSCTNNGYAATQDKKMPPCTWVATAWNPNTKANGLCAGDRAICNPMSEADCEKLDWGSPAAGGWSKYSLPMTQYGPLIATEFGSFDCSSAYVKTLLKYMKQFGISYTSWALWPQNSGGPDGLGSCGYPAVMTPAADPGDFHQCFDAATCSSLMKPMPWAGAATFADLTSH